ncbi:hypothetical protein [Streptomyces sp. NPDC060187]|uniref:hypothetical protein n=1 Tax=Streptomyces sp. NPDC060187 TaxID=3347067 RepID=UPI00364B06C2
MDNLAAAAGEERGLAQPPPARLMLLARLLDAVADVCEWDRTRWGLHSDEADLARRDAAEDRAEQALVRLKSGLADEEPETVVTVGALSASGQQLLRLLGGASGPPGVRS